MHWARGLRWSAAPPRQAAGLLWSARCLAAALGQPARAHSSRCTTASTTALLPNLGAQHPLPGAVGQLDAVVGLSVLRLLARLARRVLRDVLA